MNRHLRIAPIAAGLLLAAAVPATAQDAKGVPQPTPLPPLQLSGDGTGQVLLFPYYTVNGGNQTLLSIVNTTDAGKATRLFFREGRNSRAVMEISIYLAPHDVWTAAVFAAPDASGRAGLVTTDTSCTVPAIRHNDQLPMLGSGNRYVPFSNAGYTGERDDVGPDGLERTREGHFELIELGEVVDDRFDTLSAITHHIMGSPPPPVGTPLNCHQLVRAWEAGGYWTASPSADLTPPGGGLHGAAYLVDVLDGTMQVVVPDAIENFSGWILNTPPGQGSPTLADANTGTFNPAVSAYVFADGALVELGYPVERAIDAVSALLTADRIHNEFVTTASLGGASEWVVTFPTKRFYTDTGGAPLAPFTSSYAVQFGVDRAPVYVDFDAFSRQGIEFNCIPGHDYSGCIVGTPPPHGPVALNWSSNVFEFNRSETTTARPSAIIASALNSGVYLFNILDGSAHSEGAARMTLWDDSSEFSAIREQRLRPDFFGRRLHGVPLQGFWLTSYTNGQLTPGTLSNYSEAMRHQREMSSSAP
jgi:hypothetical protein